MTITIQNLDDLQDRRIMMEKATSLRIRLCHSGGHLHDLSAGVEHHTNRIYVSQNSGTVQASNKTYIMSSYSGTLTELYISEGSYVNEGDLVAHIKSTDLDMQQGQPGKPAQDLPDPAGPVQ